MKEKAKAKKQRGAELQNVKRGAARPKENTVEHRLAEANTRLLATVVRDSNDAITIQDFDGRITAWNRGAELMYGYSEAEALQMNIGHLTPPEKQAEQKEFTRRLILGKTIPSFETQRVTKDGRILDVWLTVTKLVDDGKPVGIASTERDITERKRAEANTRLLAMVVRDSNDAIIIQDLDGRITAWNRGAELMYGYSEAEALQMNIRHLTPPEKQAEQKEFTRRLLLGETIPPFETQRVTKDGRILDVWLTVTKLAACTADIIISTGRDIANPIGIALIERDFTERKKAEEALRESEERWRSLVTNAPDIIINLDREHRIMFISRTVAGFRAEDVIGKSIYDFTSPEHHDVIKMSIEKVFKTGEVVNYETLGSGADGKIVWYSTRIGPVESAGEVVSVLLISNDITERKKAEEERERLLQSLEEKTKELEQVLYAASHDLRSPLVNIQGFAREMEQSVEQVRSVLKIEDIPNTVREQLSAPLNEDIPSALQYIHASAYKIDSLLGGLLQLSRLGRDELDIKRLNMNKLMESVIHTFEYSIKEKGAKLEVGHLPPCLGDETRINQLFSNLIDNALKFLDPDRSGIIKINGTKEDKQVIYCVEDNGIGIAPEYHEKIFEIFERLNPTAGAGEGLGLTIVRRIADRHNGKIWLESETGKGSSFFVSLPAA